jgi:hypothetical protein
MKRAFWAASVAAVSLLGAASAQATTVYFSDFGPGNSYDGGSGWTVSTAASTINDDITSGMQFTAAASGSVDTIDIALSVAGGSGAADIDLWTDASGAFGTLLGSWHVIAAPAFGSSNNSPITISGITGVTLTAGTGYWLNATATGDTWGAWNSNTIGLMGTLKQNNSNFGGENIGAFDILGGAVPEPATWAMMIGGFGLAGAALRRRRGAIAV